jgi:hypothetical protein
VDTVPNPQIETDLAALAAVGRRVAGSEGERQMLHRVRGQLPEGTRARIEGFVAFASPNLVLLLHAALLLAAGVLGFFNAPVAAILCAMVTAHLISESSGRRSLVRWVLPKAASYNLVVPIEQDEALGTVVLVTPLDTPKWRPDRPKWLKRPLQAVVIAALVVSVLLTLRALAEPWGRPTQGMYIASLIVLGTTVALTGVAQRRVVGIREDASGSAALLELVRRLHVKPPRGVNIWFVFTGCGHAYQNGMSAFLAMHRQRLVDPTLVVAIDEPGRGQMGAVVSEGQLWAQHHRPTGPALVERLRWAGSEIPEIDHESVTDARAALLFGYRALALVGTGDDEPTAADTEGACDTIEQLVRLYGEDLVRVPRAALITEDGEE